MKHTPKEHPDYPSLEKATKQLAELSIQINEATRSIEEAKKLHDIQNTLLVGSFSDLNINSKNRSVIFQGKVDTYELKPKAEIKSQYIFAFNDLVLITTQKGDRYRVRFVIPCTKFYVRDLLSTPGQEAAFHVTYLTENEDNTQLIVHEVWLLATEAEKEFWLQSIINFKQKVKGAVCFGFLPLQLIVADEGIFKATEATVNSEKEAHLISQLNEQRKQDSKRHTQLLSEIQREQDQHEKIKEEFLILQDSYGKLKNK